MVSNRAPPGENIEAREPATETTPERSLMTTRRREREPAGVVDEERSLRVRLIREPVVEVEEGRSFLVFLTREPIAVVEEAKD